MLKTIRSRHQIDTSWLKLTWEIAIPWSQSPTGNPALRAMINIQINWSIWKTWNICQFLRQISIYCYNAHIIITLIWWIRTVNNKILLKIFHHDLSVKSDRSQLRKWGWQWCWWHRYVGDFMMVTDLRCWWQNHYVGDFSVIWWFFQCIKSVTYILNLSPTHLVSNIHLQNPSPTSM